MIWTLCLILIEANADGVDAKDASEGLARSEMFPLYYKEGTGACLWNKIRIKSRYIISIPYHDVVCQRNQ